MRATGSAGQSTVELVAATPLFLLCALLCFQALAAGATYVYADNAAHAGALAMQLGSDPERAAREAIPGWSRGRSSVLVSGSKIQVELRPRAIFPPLAGLLIARSAAEAVSP